MLQDGLVLRGCANRTVFVFCVLYVQNQQSVVVVGVIALSGFVVDVCLLVRCVLCLSFGVVLCLCCACDEVNVDSERSSVGRAFDCSG
jgi:hypothetical protein